MKELGDCFNRNAATMGSRAGEVEGGSLAGEGALIQAGATMMTELLRSGEGKRAGMR